MMMSSVNRPQLTHGQNAALGSRGAFALLTVLGIINFLLFVKLIHTTTPTQ